MYGKGLFMEYGYSFDQEMSVFQRMVAGPYYFDEFGTDDFPAFYQLMDQVKPGDTVFIPGLASLGYSFQQIRDKWLLLADAGVNICVLNKPEDIGEDNFTLFLRYLGEEEMVIRRKKQKQGYINARLRGVRAGRKKIPIPNTFTQINQEYLLGQITCREAADQLGVSRPTFLRWSKDLNEELTSSQPTGEIEPGGNIATGEMG